MRRGHRIAVVGVSIAGLFSACIAGTDPDAVRVLERTGRQNALEAAARVKAMGVKASRVAAKGQLSATTLETEGSDAAHIYMAYLADAKAGAQALQVSADAYIEGGVPPAAITIRVSGAFENGNGYSPFSSAVRGNGAARFYKAYPSSCFEHIRSAANINANFFGAYGNMTWGPVDDDASKACSNELPCEDGVTRKSRANLSSGICDDDAPIYGSGGGGDAPIDTAGGVTPTLHCYWYRDIMIIFDSNGKMLSAFWLGEWVHQCDEMILASDKQPRADASIPVVLRARGPLGTTERPTMLVAEAGDTVSIAIDTTRATAADLDAALARAGSMWKLRSPGRADSIVATSMAPTHAGKGDPGSRAAELLRRVKAGAPRHTSGRGTSRELTIEVPRRP